MTERFVDSEGRVSAIVGLLEEHHLVSLFGLPGAGKTALAHAVVRTLGADRFVAWDPQATVPRTAEYVFVDDLQAADVEALERAVGVGTSRWLVTTRRRLSLGAERSFAVRTLREDDAVELLRSFLARRSCEVSLAACRSMVDVIDPLAGQLFAAAQLIELHGPHEVAKRWAELDPLVVVLEREFESAVPPGLMGAACFADAFDADSFVHVAGDNHEGLFELVDRGLVERVSDAPPLFRMLGSVRRVAPRPTAPIQERHHRWVIEHGARMDLLDLVNQRDSEEVDDDVFTAAVERLCHGPLPPTSAVDAAIELAEADRLAMLLCARARIALRDGDPTTAERLRSEAVPYVGSERTQVALHSVRAQLARMTATPEEALKEYEDALLLGEVTDDLVLEHAATLWESGEHAAARNATRDALERARATDDVLREGVITSNLGVMAHHAGELAEARELHEAALALHIEAGNRRFEAIAEFDLGTLDHELGILRRALRHYDRGIELLREVRDRRLSELACAAAEAARAQLAEPAVWSVEKIERGFATVGDALFTEVAGLYRQLIEALGGDPVPVIDPSAFHRRPDEVQLPARLLAELTEAQARERLLVVSPAIDRFCLGSLEVDLSGRDALRRTFGLFVETRLETGTCVSLDDIITHGWPDETVTEEAAKNRAHVALSTLRRLGLRDVLQTLDGGYRLDALVCIAQMSTGPTAASS